MNIYAQVEAATYMLQVFYQQRAVAEAANRDTTCIRHAIGCTELHIRQLQKELREHPTWTLS
jgi:hypothetical protein